MKKYEWAVVGSGIAGISIAEILSREGHSVVLIEKNSKLASETTREFHEWLHTGSLYTLLPDRLKTLRYILGAIDQGAADKKLLAQINRDKALRTAFEASKAQDKLQEELTKYKDSFKY